MDTASAVRTAGALLNAGFNFAIRQGAQAGDWAIDVNPTTDIAASAVASFAASESVGAFFTPAGTIELR